VALIAEIGFGYREPYSPPAAVTEVYVSIESMRYWKYYRSLFRARKIGMRWIFRSTPSHGKCTGWKIRFT